jgi:hypothetical protein
MFSGVQVDQGVFPGGLKVSIIKLIFKFGEYSSVENYRYISLLPSFLKVAEKVLG